MLFWQVTVAVVQYLQWPTDTKLELKFSPTLALPALSICNLNSARKSAILGKNPVPGVHQLQRFLNNVSIYFDSVRLCGLIVHSSEDELTLKTIIFLNTLPTSLV